MTPVGTVLVHKKCCRNFTDQKRAMQSSVKDNEIPCVKKLRSSLLPFNLKELCMLCGKSAVVDIRHPNRTQVKAVPTLLIRSNILEQCNKRRDSWASEVQTLLQGCIDLVAAEAVYHSNCFSLFMLNKN